MFHSEILRSRDRVLPRPVSLGASQRQGKACPLHRHPLIKSAAGHTSPRFFLCIFPPAWYNPTVKRQRNRLDRGPAERMTVMMDMTEKTLERKEMFKGRIVSVHVDRVSLPDGSEAPREVVDHNGGVAVLALDGEKIGRAHV